MTRLSERATLYVMVRSVTVAALIALLSGALCAQEPGVLRIRISLVNAAQAVLPVPRHALLISDNPATSTPRRVVTNREGIAEIRLRPGNYTIESEEPVTFGGKGYQWLNTVDVAAGRDVTLEFTAANAEIGAATASASSPTSDSPSDSLAAPDNDPSFLLPEWQQSVVAVWTPSARASGFLVSGDGMVLTNQRSIGDATSTEVQLSATTKVVATVLASDVGRDVAALWVEPSVVKMVTPLVLSCATAAAGPVAPGQRVTALGAPLHGDKDMSSADTRRTASATIADLRLAEGSLGGPVFGSAGTVIGLTSTASKEDESSRGDARIVPVSDACEVIKAAEKAMQTASRPVATPRPTDPQQVFPGDALQAIVKRRVGSLNPYAVASEEFDLAFMTPIHVYAAEQARGARPQQGRISLTDFGGWSPYFQDAPPVLAIRVTPKMAESIWATMARGAAMTQGMAIPAIKRFKAGFSRLQAYCGDVEVLPIHPFTLDTGISDTDAVREGLYVFDPNAIGPHCSSVKLVMYSVKEPTKADSKVIDQAVLERIWQDFEPYRALPPAAVPSSDNGVR